MCLEESFCLFTWDALNFRQPKIYAAPHHLPVNGFSFQLLIYAISAIKKMIFSKTETNYLFILRDLSYFRLYI